MWQERQKLVCLDRSKCSEAPQVAQKLGSTKNATNASILPSRDIVTEGRATITARINTVTAISAYRKNAGCGSIDTSYKLQREVSRRPLVSDPVYFFPSARQYATRSLISFSLSCFSYAGILFLPFAITCASTSSDSPCTSGE